MALALDLSALYGSVNGGDQIEWYEFLRLQSEIRNDLLSLTGDTSGIGALDVSYYLDWSDAKAPKLFALCFTAMEAIRASVEIVRLRGATFKSCPWCKKIFEFKVIGGNEKAFCTPLHGRMSAIYEKRKTESCQACRKNRQEENEDAVR